MSRKQQKEKGRERGNKRIKAETTRGERRKEEIGEEGQKQRQNEGQHQRGRNLLLLLLLLQEYLLVEKGLLL